MKEFILSHDAARDQIDIFLDYYDIDLDDLPEKQAEAVEASVTRIIKGIRRGKVEIKEEDSLTITQHLRNDKTIIYGEISGRSKIAMGGKRENDHHGRMYALCGSLTGLGEAGILKLKGADLGLCECIGALFLQV